MRRVLELVYEHQQKKMGPPSYVEIGDKLGISSKSGVHRLILSCQERGLVTRQNRRARTLMLTDWGLTFVQRAEEKVSQQCCPSCGAKLSIRLE
jgi:SOS-response transcriptional repressor LexA